MIRSILSENLRSYHARRRQRLTPPSCRTASARMR